MSYFKWYVFLEVIFLQISRLFQILYILLERKTTTAAELAERFEVSTRTIYRDVGALSEAGIPIYTTQGKGGGISLIDSFILNKSLFSEKEQANILLAIESLSAAKFPDVDELLAKLKHFFMKNNTNWIEIDFSAWGSGESQKEKFTQLKHAILNRHSLSFSYYSSSQQKSSRTITPLKLLFKDHAWYVQGYCLERMAYRTFKITRMTDVSVIENPAPDIISNEGIPPVQSQQSTATNICLKLKISAEGAYRIYDDFNEKSITEEKDGSFIINTVMPDGEWIFYFLLSYGPMLEVIEPEKIRLGMVQYINKLKHNYSS